MLYKDERLERYYPYIFPRPFWQLPALLELIERIKTGQRTFYFNTGVSQRMYGYVPLCEGQIWMGGTKQIPFDCYNVPEGATFEFACDYPDLPESQTCIVREIHNSTLISKYAYFTNPKVN